MTDMEQAPMRGRRQPNRADVLTSERLRVLDEPLAEAMLARIRDSRTSGAEFTSLSEQIATRLVWTALEDATLRPARIIGFDGASVDVAEIADRVAAVVILRAGLLFAQPFRSLLPDAPIYQVGARRDEASLEPRLYTSNLPDTPEWADRILLLDPMIATGGSAKRAIAEIRRTCSCRIDVVSLIAAPLGVRVLLDADPAVHIVTAALDRELNEQGFIVPGLGDAGDRLFGTIVHP